MPLRQVLWLAGVKHDSLHGLRNRAPDRAAPLAKSGTTLEALGDGGIDGLGSDETGEVVAVMQAKYYASTAPELASVDARRNP